MKRSEAVDIIKKSYELLSSFTNEQEDNVCTILNLPTRDFRDIKEVYIELYNETLTYHDTLDSTILNDVAQFATGINHLLLRASNESDTVFRDLEEEKKLTNMLQERWRNYLIRQDELVNEVRDQISESLQGELRFTDDSSEDERVEMREEINDLRNAKNRLESLIEEQTKRYQPVFANQEFELQRDLFKGTAKSYEVKSYFWIGGIVLSTIAFVVLISIIRENFCFDLSCFNIKTLSGYKPICEDCGKHLLWLEMFKAVFFRFILISLNIYLISFCVKNYNASMHNKVINETRQNTFNVALHFYNTTVGEGKEDVLRRASESLFSHRNTGYNGKHSEPTTPSFVQNIIDKVNPSK